MNISLVVEKGPHAGKTISVKGEEFLIGRSTKCHLRPNSAAVSKRHCLILLRDGKVFLRDLDSTNGTFVNKKQIKGEIELQDKDQLTIGPLDLIFRFQLEGTVQEPAEDTIQESKEEPLPAAPKSRKPVQKGGPVDEEDIAEMMLELTEDEGEDTSGSTMMEIPAFLMKESTRDRQLAKSKDRRGQEDPADTSAAAQEILEKITRRRG
ncbi:MAG: FHA domain-containing protein [Gemmataceae bacterium]